MKPQETAPFRLPITAVLVVGFGGLVAVAVAVVLYLGVAIGRQNTLDLLSDKAEAAIDSMVSHIDRRLRPIVAQALWISKEVSRGSLEIGDRGNLDSFMLGALAGTPQTAGIALIQRNGEYLRYMRDERNVVEAITEHNADFTAWFAEVENAEGPKWRQPNWDNPLNEPILILETPLRRDEVLLGILVQVVPVSSFSRYIANKVSVTGFDTPFILLEKSRVLAHPLLASLTPEARSEQNLPTVEEIGDVILESMWSDTHSEESFLKMTRSEVRIVNLENYFAVLFRTVEGYGDKPWTVGIYFNTVHGGSEVVRLRHAFLSGLIILLVSVIVAIVFAKTLAKPVHRISESALTVRSGDLGAVEDLPSNHIRELDDASRSFNEMVHGLRDRDMIRETLGRYVPERVAETLLKGGGELSPEETVASVLFSDIEGFTAMIQDLGPQGTVEVLNVYFSAMVEILEEHGGVVTQFQGDGILATFNVPIVADDHAEKALGAAQKMIEACRSQSFAGRRLGCRVGINTGSVIAGAVGANDRLTYTVHGDAVNLAARLEALNKDLGTRILVSGSTAALVQSHELAARGTQAVRGVAADVEIFELVVPESG